MPYAYILENLFLVNLSHFTYYLQLEQIILKGEMSSYHLLDFLASVSLIWEIGRSENADIERRHYLVLIEKECYFKME